MQEKQAPAPSSSPMISTGEAFAMIGVLVAGVVVLGTLVFMNL